MVDLNGHEAGNGGYSQGRPTARRVLLYSERCLVIPENEMLAPPGVYLPARSAFLRLAWDRMRTIKVIRSARASRFCACPPSYAKDAPCMLEFPGSRSWLLAAFVQPPGVEITLSPYQTICRSPLSTDRGGATSFHGWMRLRCEEAALGRAPLQEEKRDPSTAVGMTEKMRSRWARLKSCARTGRRARCIVPQRETAAGRVKINIPTLA